jgi:hypothetical protein
LVNVPELHPGGKPAIFQAKLQDNVISDFISCKPNITSEKNWMPFLDDNVNKVIYSLNPFIIKSIDKDDLEEIYVPEYNKKLLNGYHGSTNGIFLNEYERLFLIHINKETTIHRWLLFNVKTKTIILSEEFVFFKNSYLEFTCSLSKYNERIFISLGVNDDKAYIIETNIEDIERIFIRNIPNYPTLVTMLYDIRSMENKTIERNRKLDSYIDFSKQFLLKLPYPIVFFIDSNKEAYDAIYNARKDKNLLNLPPCSLKYSLCCV